MEGYVLALACVLGAQSGPFVLLLGLSENVLFGLFENVLYVICRRERVHNRGG